MDGRRANFLHESFDRGVGSAIKSEFTVPRPLNCIYIIHITFAKNSETRTLTQSLKI